MQAIDRAAIEELGIPRLLLMEHAGLAVARAAAAILRKPSARPVLICSGTGFNGGDGLAAARHLREWGYPLHAVLLGRLGSLQEEPAAYARILNQLGVTILEWSSPHAAARVTSWLKRCGLIIDALLGIGVRGVVRHPMASLIARLNRTGVPIVSADIPSGLDADSGRVHGVAIRATVTVTFGLPKHGCLMGQGPAHVGSLTVDPITLPRELLTRPPT